MSHESCFITDTDVQCEVKKSFYNLPTSWKTQKHLVSIVSKFYFLWLCKTGKFDIIIKKSSFIVFHYNLFNARFVYCCILFFLLIKLLGFCYEKVYLGSTFSFEVYEKNVREKVTNCSLKATGVLLNADEHVLS